MSFILLVNSSTRNDPSILFYPIQPLRRIQPDWLSPPKSELRVIQSFASRVNTYLSCVQLTQTFPSIVTILPLTCASDFPALTTSLSTLYTPGGTGLRYVTVKVRETCPASRNPGRAIVSSAVLVKLSRTVAAAPPWRFPALLQREAVTVNSKTVDLVEEEAERRRH